ncbi:class I SAM-dependent methyltransferase [Kitasatospora acidiphila]|uniref:class I SAM-dependent methyltransferase n=1 Tax=Kitasatospora acidiphila TaxID=2567942 RepID=UPI003C78F373
MSHMQLQRCSVGSRMTSPTTDFGAVGGSYAHYNTSGRGRLRHDLVARRLLADLPRTPAGVLDLGCGDGEMTLRLASAGHRVTGVDPSAGMLASAAERLGTRAETAGRVRLLQADIATLPTHLGVFDAVCCSRPFGRPSGRSTRRSWPPAE